MSEPKFTPGPWSINEWPQAISDIAIGAVGTPLIAKVPLRDVSINEQKANAHLIAAAPELYEALEKIRHWGESQHKAQSKGGHATFDMMMLREQIDTAKAALEKARGESHE